MLKPVLGTGQCDGGEEGASCEENDGIQLSSSADLAFLMRPAEDGFETSAAWIAALSPFTFEHVTLAQTQK